MPDRLRIIVITTLMAIALWLFAEAESLGTQSGITTLRFVSGDNRDRLIFAAEEFDGTITVSMEGSRAALARAEGVLSRGLRLEPGMPGVPAATGQYSVNLLQTLRQYEPLTSTGVEVASVAPLLVDIEVVELASRELPVEAVLGSIEVVGAVRVTPERVTVRLPRSEAGLLPENTVLRARPDEAQLRAVQAGGTARIEVRVEAPPTLAVMPGFALTPATVTVEFAVRSRTGVAELPSVPVQVVMPSIEVGRWAVEVHPEDRFVTAEVSGPIDLLGAMRGGPLALIAVVALSSDELQARVTGKPASFLVQRDGVFAMLPELRVTSPAPTVRLTITPIEQEGAAP